MNNTIQTNSSNQHVKNLQSVCRIRRRRVNSVWRALEFGHPVQCRSCNIACRDGHSAVTCRGNSGNTTACHLITFLVRRIIGFLAARDVGPIRSRRLWCPVAKRILQPLLYILLLCLHNSICFNTVRTCEGLISVLAVFMHIAHSLLNIVEHFAWHSGHQQLLDAYSVIPTTSYTQSLM